MTTPETESVFTLKRPARQHPVSQADGAFRLHARESAFLLPRLALKSVNRLCWVRASGQNQ